MKSSQSILRAALSIITPTKMCIRDRYLIGMSQCNLAEPWRKQMDADIAAAAADHPELKVLFKDAQGKAETQQAHVREFIDQGVDLIIISPLEAQPLTEPVEEAMKEGIPVIVLDLSLIHISIAPSSSPWSRPLAASRSPR